MSESTCASCRRSIDAAAKLCPYCGANPVTGERIDTQAILQEIFRPKDISTGESVLEYARQRQGVVITVSVIVAFLVLAGIHQFVTMRNASAVSDAPAVPLTEIVDSPTEATTAKPVQMPELDFQYSGQAARMRTYIAERGAIAPAPPAPAPGQPVAQPQPAAQPGPQQVPPPQPR
jgi:hypothetical protein